MGKIYDGEGERPDLEYISAILRLEAPGNKKQLLSVLGMINYLVK